MAESPNFYAIIPANVRYDKELSANAKLLYGEITSLCNKEGYCWATNSYFAELYNVSNKSISLWIKQLVQKGYIKSTLIYKDGTNEILHRYLHLCGEGMEKNFHSPMEKKVKENSKSINTKKNSKLESIKKHLSTINNPLLNIESLREWLEYKNYNYQLVGVNKLIKMLTKYSYDIQQEIIDKSIMNNYQGLFEPKGNKDKANSNNNNEWSDGITRCDPNEYR